MVNRAEAIELAKRLVASCHEKTPPPLSTTLLAEVEARENAELLARAIEEGSAEWEERCKIAETKTKTLEAQNRIMKSKLEMIAKQMTSEEQEEDDNEPDVDCMAEAYEIIVLEARQTLLGINKHL